MEMFYHNRPGIDCTEMERTCPDTIDPILNIPWCPQPDDSEHVQPQDFVRKGDINGMCYSLSSLIQWIERDLEVNPVPRDTNRVPIPNILLLRLGAQYIHNGNELPPRLGVYIDNLLKKELTGGAVRLAAAVLNGWTANDWRTREGGPVPSVFSLSKRSLIEILKLSPSAVQRRHPLDLADTTDQGIQNLAINLIWQHYNVERDLRLVSFEVPDSTLPVARYELNAGKRKERSGRRGGPVSYVQSIDAFGNTIRSKR